MKEQTMPAKALSQIENELRQGMSLRKCRQCRCMKEALEAVRSALLRQPNRALASEIDRWRKQMEPIRYACLGCDYCYPAVATNLLQQALPEAAESISLGCGFQVDTSTWPPVAGEYYAFCDGPGCPVAITTLGSIHLADELAGRRPPELCVVGKTETENIGIDKVIKNTISNPTIRYLVVVGEDPEGHRSGQTLLALAENGVDETMRVIGSRGKRPVLRNVNRDEVEAFRRQVQVINMLGCCDIEQVLDRVRTLSAAQPACGCGHADRQPEAVRVSTVPVIQAKAPAKVEMDRAGYFVVLPQAAKGTIVVEHYAYDNRLQHVIEGKDARSIYSTLIENGWVSQLSHAAYLGKELARAELSIKLGFKYIQDGA